MSQKNPTVIQINASQEEIKEFRRDGGNLIIVLQDGKTLTIVGFFDADHSVVAFIRKSKRGRGRKQEQILCVCNFTPMEWDKYLIPLPKKSKLTKILDSSELDLVEMVMFQKQKFQQNV